MKWRGGRIGRGEALQVDRERVGDAGGRKGWIRCDDEYIELNTL